MRCGVSTPTKACRSLVVWKCDRFQALSVSPAISDHRVLFRHVLVHSSSCLGLMFGIYMLYIYICTDICTHMLVRILRKHVLTCYIYIRISTYCIYVCRYVCNSICIYIYTHVYTRIHIHTYIYIYTHIHICTHAYMCMYTCAYCMICVHV